MAALDGLRVVEFAGGLAIALAGRIFADHGAQVVRIEDNDDPHVADEAVGVALNRGKRILHGTAHRSALARLLSKADVCIVRRRAALSDRGLAPYPGLITLEMPPGLPGDATQWEPDVESNGLLSAYLGMAQRQSSFDGNPVDLVSPQFLYLQGLWAATSAVSALIERQHSGAGQTVTVAGMHGVLVPAVTVLTMRKGAPDPDTAIGPGGRHPTYSRYRTGDGTWLACGGLGPKFERATLEATGQAGMLDDPEGLAATDGLLGINRYEIIDRVAEAFAQRPRHEWLEILTDHGVPCCPVHRPGGWLDDPQLIASGQRLEADDPAHGRVVLTGVPVTLTDTPGAIGPAAQRVEIDEIAWRERPPGPSPSRNSHGTHPGPLGGLRVLVLGTFIAGPYTGFLLNALGADVIKVEPPGGDPFRNTGYTYNRGLRSISIDLLGGGIDAFYRLAATADVVINSLRPGTAETMHIDHDALRRVRPDIITVGISAYGEAGPMAREPGFDMLMQAASGMMMRQGGDDDPVAQTLAIVDTTTAALAASAAVLAVYRRNAASTGQHAWTSLAAAAAFLQTCELTSYPGRPPTPVGGRDFRGPAPLERLYPTADGWIRVHRPSTAPPDRLRHGDPLLDGGLDADPERLQSLQQTLGVMASADAIPWLATAGIAAAAARRISDVVADPELLDAGFVEVVDGAQGPLVVPATFAVFSRTPASHRRVLHGVGEDSIAVLREAGLSGEEIALLVDSGTVVAGGPVPQSLSPMYR